MLAGHSLGGLTIPGVAAKIPARIKRVVWVTAMVALDGQPIIDPATSPLAAAMESMPERSITIEMMGKEFLDGLANDMAPAVREYVLSALGPEPIAPLVAPVRDGALLRDRNSEQLYRVRGRSDAGRGRAELASAFYSSRLKNPTLKFVKSGHEVMFTHPVECARALHELARGE